MEIPDSNTWIENSLLSVGEQDVEEQHHEEQHALYATDLPPLDHLGQRFHLGQSLAATFEDGSQQAAAHHAQELQQAQQFSSQAVVEQTQSGFRANDIGDLASVRRVHKADREKLRRDKLNEQFTELASALDPDRPKNDKATILSDSVQELNELRAEVKRLKAEHAALLDESRDLTQEKSELREEKALLKTETEQLQSQLQHRLRLALSWTAMDPSLMMGATAFPYPVPVPSPSPMSQQAPPSSQTPTMPSPMMPQSPFPPALPLPPFGMHPYAMFAATANRPGSGNMPYFPYFPPQSLVGATNPPVERPFPQYPSPMNPPRGYGGVQEGSQPAFFQPSLAEAPYKPFVANQVVAGRETSEQVAEPVDDQNPAQVEGSSSPSAAVKQESCAKSVSPAREGSTDSGCVVGYASSPSDVHKHASVRPAVA